LRLILPLSLQPLTSLDLDLFHLCLLIVFFSARLPGISEREELVLAHHRQTCTMALSAAMGTSGADEVTSALVHLDDLADMAQSFSCCNCKSSEEGRETSE